MRIFGLLGLVVVLAIIGLTLKKQLAGTTRVPASISVPDSTGTPTNVRVESQQLQQQIKQQLDATMSQPRPMPDEN